jgi:diguanylate cyclase (GGDEF)-like protein
MKKIIEKLKQIRFKELIVAIPPELKVQFDQMQLKNNLFRLKLLGVITILFNLMNFPFYILHADGINALLFDKLFLADLCQLFITLLFIILTGCFSKKSKHSMLWFMCYLFILLHYLFWSYYMFFADIVLALQIFYVFASLYTFVPDFKPKIFISFLVFWYITVAGLLAYKNQSFAFGGSQLFTINVFSIALVRIFYYNSKVETFIDTFKIKTLNEKLEALSMTDELTKLNNRRSFLDYFDLVWKQNRRLKLPVSVLMVDVDYFKKYNDSLGHLEGDKALIAIAQCMKNQVKRDTDFVARFGGEEFVCLLPFLEKDNALNFARELVQSVESMKINHPMSEVSKYITISVGMASVIPNEQNSPTQLLDEADKALYEAKHSGRNRVFRSS